jgi:hypothetical protein
MLMENHYSEKLARHVIKTFNAIRLVPEGLSRTDLINVFRRHITADQLTECLYVFETAGYLVKEVKKTAGRPAEIWKSA